MTLGNPPTVNTFTFKRLPRIVSLASVVGPMEGAGPLGDFFDEVCRDDLMGEKSWEAAERLLFMSALQHCLKKAGPGPEADLLIGGDLLNQIVTSGYSARYFDVPFLGLYGACSTFAESLLMGAILVDGRYRERVLCATSSHHNSAERQFRLPTEFAAQRPPVAQWTVTGAAACLIASDDAEDEETPRLVIESATAGRVVDYDVTDPYDLGSAMAPAAVDTIMTHLRDTDRRPEHYDLILTGDLARHGRQMALKLFEQQGAGPTEDQFVDAGEMIYGRNQNVKSGGSGCASSACVFCGYVWDLLKRGQVKRVLIVATGALLSPLIAKQGESIPGIAHAVSVEMREPG